MESRNENRVKYTGPLKAIVFDYAGTVVDYGCCSPVGTFQAIFRQECVEISEKDARGPMGTHKRDHIKILLSDSDILTRWIDAKKVPPTEEDIDRMYHNFTPIQKEGIKDSHVITGVPETVKRLREEYSLKIGSSTGYPREILDLQLVIAAKEGFIPDCAIAGDEVPKARPSPFMLWLNCHRLNVFPVQAVVKVDDTTDGIGEGLAAGSWTIAVVRTGNSVGLSEEALAALAPDERDQRIKDAYKELAKSGAHYIIDSVNDIFPVIEDINARMANGESP